MDVAKLKNLLLQTTKMNQKNIYYKDDNFTLLKGELFGIVQGEIVKFLNSAPEIGVEFCFV